MRGGVFELPLILVVLVAVAVATSSEALERKTGLRVEPRILDDNASIRYSSVAGFHSDGLGHQSRSLGEADVGLFASGGPGTCQIRNSLDTLYNGETAAFGAVFTVQALTNSVDIQGIEFANMEASKESAVKIFVIKSDTFSSNPNDWIELASTTSVPSPDGLGAIAPRADFTRSVSFNQGDVWTFYVSLESGNLKMADSGTTGSSYQVDNFLQLNVGESMDTGAEFTAARTPNKAFQGKLYYRVLKPCNTLGTQTELIFPFATDAGTDRVALNAAVSAGFERLLANETDLVRWVNVYGLAIKTITLKSLGSQDDCTEYGIAGACDLYDSDVQLSHYQSLSDRELILEFMLKLNNRKGLGPLDNNINVVFTGDEVFEQQYDVTLSGVPFGTVLNPIQREYLEKVTYDFLDEFSDAQPHRVTVRQAVEGRRQLRGREEISGAVGAFGQRRLQERGIVHSEAIVYGIGDDKKEFLKELDDAFLKNTDQYKEEVQKQQYLPGDINDRTNLGGIFSGLVGIKVKRIGSDEAVLASSGEVPPDDKLDSTQIQIISFSSAIGLATLWIIYRILKDCVWVQSGWEVKNEKLSTATESNLSRPELENMDKPRQKPRPSAVLDISTMKDIKLSSMDDSVRDEGSVRRGRRPPGARGVGRAKSSDDIDFFEPSSSRPARAKSDFPPATPTRGVARHKSADDDLFFPGSTRSTGEPTRGVGRAKSSDDIDFGLPTRRHSTADGLPTRGVGRAKSTDDMDFGMRRESSSAHGRSAPPSRGVGMSKSSDLAGMVGASRRPSTPTGQVRPPPATRGVAKSNTFSGVEGFLGSNHNNGAAGGKNGVTPASKKKKKKKKTDNGEEGPATTKKKKKVTKAKSTASQSSEGSGKMSEDSGKKKTKTGVKGKKTKKKSNIEKDGDPASGRPPKPPRRVDMTGAAASPPPLPRD